MNSVCFKELVDHWCHLSLKIVHDDEQAVLNLPRHLAGLWYREQWSWWCIGPLFAPWTNAWGSGSQANHLNRGWQHGLLPLYINCSGRKSPVRLPQKTAVICHLSLAPEISTHLDPSFIHRPRWRWNQMNTSLSQFRTSSGGTSSIVGTAAASARKAEVGLVSWEGVWLSHRLTNHHLFHSDTSNTLTW